MSPLPCNHSSDAVSFANAFKTTRASKNSLLSPATIGITWASGSPTHLSMSLREVLKDYQRKMVGNNSNCLSTPNILIKLYIFWSNWKNPGSSLGKLKENSQAAISWRGKSVGSVSVSSSSELCPSLTPIVIKAYFATGMSGVIDRTWTCE